MKYILMMNAPKAGIDTYRAWSEKDVQTHFGVLRAINKDLTESGEFVATEGLAGRSRPKLCEPVRMATRSPTECFRNRKSSCSATGLSMWTIPERAYEIAARISAAPGPGGVPTDMPIEVRQIMTSKPAELP